MLSALVVVAAMAYEDPHLRVVVEDRHTTEIVKTRKGNAIVEERRDRVASIAHIFRGRREISQGELVSLLEQSNAVPAYTAHLRATRAFGATCGVIALGGLVAAAAGGVTLLTAPSFTSSQAYVGEIALTGGGATFLIAGITGLVGGSESLSASEVRAGVMAYNRWLDGRRR